ncbi:cysteine hydrolase family protein [Bacillus cereus]|uniref:cysteine hydrolase family protein n=1 Tax=Bacillus TaxID=1386 RepID=UPI000BFB928A|nr:MULTISPECIES: cysteine hydrolase family protein [Bacillus cereus group]BCA34124.1 isochorismatase [Bacillus wiedmannii]MBT2198179.1 cysteine hydrolase [Bacillus thuringiensis]MCC2444790.1 cysteine hydrolase [Bacillus cereus]MCU5474315.1 cysteine hydrolase [Bacillus cereus]MCU5613571.1 cysteine hydrolase [Bacillus cereus]
MKEALLLVDIQNDYFAGGNMELHQPEKAAHKAKEVLKVFREKHKTVIHVQHIANNEGATFFLPDTVGVQIYDDVQPIANERVIQKHHPNSFLRTNLLETLKTEEIDQLVICGMMTHVCIDATVRAASDFGFQCIVIEDACTTKDLEFQGNVIPAVHAHQSFMSALEFGDIYATIMSASCFINKSK